MKMNRLFEMVYLLLEKKIMTAGELAEHFEVSVRTVYRDIELLGQAGIPIYTNKGRGGGIGLLEGFILNKTVLSNQEKGDILWALQGTSAVKASENQQTLSKLTSLFGAESSDWFTVDFSDWGDSQQILFEQLKEAVIQKKVLEFDYYNSKGIKSHRQAEPFSLWFKAKAWYLRARCKNSGEMRLFKLSRFRNVSVTELHFKEQFEKEEEKDNIDQKLAVPETNMLTVKLHIDASETYRIYDEYGEDYLVKQEDGSFLATLICPENEWIYSYILSYGEHAHVLEPEHVKIRLQEKIKKIEKLYK